METTDIFSIDPAVRESFPDINVGVGVIRGVAVGRHSPEVEKHKSEVIADARNELKGRSLGELPRVQAFRRIYRRFGVDPGSHRPSSEALLSRAKDPSKGLYRVNSVVDVYNVCSIEHQLPMAAYEFHRVSFPIVLRFSKAGEVFRGIGETRTEALPENTLVYADQDKILCRDFNYRDADATKVTLETRDLVVFVDGCDQVDAVNLKDILYSVCARITRFNGGTVESAHVYPQT